MPNAPFLSVIIPAHNEENRLPASLEGLRAFLSGQAYASEIVVVENGSTDRTADCVRDLIPRIPGLRLIQTRRRGKGLAVRHGMLKSLGAYRFLCDADFSMPPEEMGRFLPPVLQGVDVAIGSREAAGARRIGEPAYRHITGRVFSIAVKALILRGFEDTQCGFKCFGRAAAEYLFARQRFTGWSFDVEVLYLARRRGFRIHEVPIPWRFNADSRVRLAGDSIAMFADLVRIRWNAARGVYDSINPEALAES